MPGWVYHPREGFVPHVDTVSPVARAWLGLPPLRQPRAIHRHCQPRGQSSPKPGLLPGEQVPLGWEQRPPMSRDGGVCVISTWHCTFHVCPRRTLCRDRSMLSTFASPTSRDGAACATGTWLCTFRVCPRRTLCGDCSTLSTLASLVAGKLQDPVSTASTGLLKYSKSMNRLKVLTPE